MSGDIEQMIRAGMQQQGQPAQMVIAAPMNDVQCLGLMAAHIMGGNRGVSPSAAVEAAIDALAETFVQHNSGGWQKAVDRARNRLQLQNGHGHGPV